MRLRHATILLLTGSSLALGASACLAQESQEAPCAAATERSAAGEIEDLLTAYHRVGRFDGVALVARGDCVLLERGWGLANRDWGIPNEPDARFRIASITKAFTAVAIHELALAGRLDLDAPASRYLAAMDAAATGRYTVRQLLWHRSGLPDFNYDPEFFDYVQRTSTPWDSVLARAAQAPLRFTPGSDFGYSNDGYWLLGAVLESVTGESWAAAIDSLVLRPLGLEHTVPDDPLAPQPRRATGYRDAFDGLTVALPYRATADAGLWSTAGDLHRFLAALTDPARTPEPLRRAIWEDRPDGNAQGWTRDTVRFTPDGPRYRLFRQDGAVYGFFATTFLVPERGWIVILLTNYRRPYNSLREIAMQVTGVLEGGTPTPPVETLGSRVEALRRTEGVDRAIGCLRDARCRGAAVVNETELNVWAWFLAERGEPDHAVRAFDALTALLPTAAATWYGLASNAADVGDVATARRALESLLALDPTNAGGLALRARLEERTH